MIPRAFLLITILAIGGCSDDPSDEALEPSGFRSLEDGLELYWTFEDHVDDKITDLSGNGRWGKLYGGSFVTSPFGQAVSLDGVDDYITLFGLRDPSLYGGVDGDFTISARVKVADLGRYNTLCYGCGPFASLHVGTDTDGPKLTAGLYNQQTGGNVWPQSSPKLLAEQWREITLVVDGGTSARYYFDCEFDVQIDNPSIGLHDYDYSLVGWSSNASRWFQGEIDSLRVWSRALDESELAQLCPEPPPLQQHLELHWTFEDRSGNQVTDVSGNARHGTVQGGSFVGVGGGEAVSLDGVDDYVSFTGPRAPAIYGGVDGDFTISARVRVSDLAKYNTLCYGCGPFSSWYLGDPTLGGRGNAAFYNKSTNGALWSASTPAMSEDQWTEVTMIVDGGVSVRHYFDCAFDSERLSSDLGLKDYNFSAVGQSSNPARWFGGAIDELRVWSRVLSEDELLLLCPCQGPIYVDVDAPPGGDGNSWATAFNNLQTAIDASNGCSQSQIWVAEGTYALDPTSAVATIDTPVSIYGGFAGTETALEQRDIAAHPVRLGADGWQTRVVVIEPSAVSELDSVRLDGFTISGSQGGAIQVTGALAPQPPTSVFLHNLTITNNSAAKGAGIWADGSAGVEVASSHFEGNQSTRGAAIHLYGRGSFHVVDSNFSGNSATAWGGAIFVDDDPADGSYMRFTIDGGEFAANTASSGAGAIYLEESSATIQSAVFIENTGGRGGAIEVANADAAVSPDAVEIEHCRFIRNQATTGAGGGLSLRELTGTSVINTEIAENVAAGAGGGVWGRGSFINVTIAYNQAGGSGDGLYAPAGPDLHMRHVVVWPDLMTAVGDNIYLGWECVATHWKYKSDYGASIHTVDNPYAPADLDNDGRTEYYLKPWPCVDFNDINKVGGDSPEFDWSVLTTEASQCTDVSRTDPGMHYPPLFDGGVCP